MCSLLCKKGFTNYLEIDIVKIAIKFKKIYGNKARN